MQRNTFAFIVSIAIAGAVLALINVGAMPLSFAPDAAINARVKNAASILQQSGVTDGKRIPGELFGQAKAVAVFPARERNEKGAQKGLLSERLADGHWSAPAFIDMSATGLTPEAGPSRNIILVFNDADALRTLEEGSSLKLGVDASMAAGPVGQKTEETEAKLETAIFAYSRDGNGFTGTDPKGAVLNNDDDSNRQIYGSDVTAKKIFLSETLMANTIVKPFLDALQQITMIRKLA